MLSECIYVLKICKHLQSHQDDKNRPQELEYASLEDVSSISFPQNLQGGGNIYTMFVNQVAMSVPSTHSDV